MLRSIGVNDNIDDAWDDDRILDLATRIVDIDSQGFKKAGQKGKSSNRVALRIDGLEWCALRHTHAHADDGQCPISGGVDDLCEFIHLVRQHHESLEIYRRKARNARLQPWSGKLAAILVGRDDMGKAMG